MKTHESELALQLHRIVCQDDSPFAISEYPKFKLMDKNAEKVICKGYVGVAKKILESEKDYIDLDCIIKKADENNYSYTQTVKSVEETR